MGVAGSIFFSAEYAQALAFDQLKAQMQNNSAFAGFHEAPINFAPTFKYDVVNRSKTKRRRKRAHADKEGDGHTTEKENGEEEEPAEECDGEARSVVSSAWTLHSRGVASTSDPDEEEYSTTFTPGSSESNRIPLVAVAYKAKAKWKSILSPSPASSSAASPITKWLRAKNGQGELPPASPTIRKQPPSLPASLDDVAADSSEPASPRNGLLPRPLSKEHNLRPPQRGISVKSLAYQLDEDDDKAVYDSSHKQRVPSWSVFVSCTFSDTCITAYRCDRILWKSVVNTSDADPDTPETTKHRNRISTLITQAFRPVSVRVRRDSAGSFNSEDSSPRPDVLPRTSIPIFRGAAENVSSRPLSFNLSRPRPCRSHSIEAIDFIKEGRQGPFRPTSEALDHLGWKSIDAGSTPNSSGLHSLQTTSSSYARAPSTDEHTVEPTVQKDPIPPPSLATRWRFFPFRRDTSQTVTQDTVLPQHIRGDVVCLSYNTLDDRRMRRLEGRSDHRPVIGSYAVYL